MHPMPVWKSFREFGGAEMLPDSHRTLRSANCQRQLLPGRFTIESVESSRQELHYEDAAGFANRISAVR